MPVDEYVRRLPAPALRGRVAAVSGYRQAGLPPALHRGLPSPYLTVVLTLDEPLVVLAHPDPAQPPSTHRSLVGGLHTAPALLSHDGSQAGVQLDVHPLAARALLGLPAGELAGVDVEADEVLGPVATELRERLCAAPTWSARFAVVDEVLLRSADPDREVAPEVARAWQLLQATGGRASVAELAEETGWSARHLGTRFAVEVGLAPKAAARVTRFDRARRLLQSGRVTRLADLAAVCGYSDQAHLTREFRELAGCPPGTWAREEPLPGQQFRSVQDGGPPDA